VAVALAAQYANHVHLAQDR